MATTVARKATARRLDMPTLRTVVAEFDGLSKQADLLGKRVAEAKGAMRGALDSRLATVDDKGHRWIEFEPPVGDVKSIKHEKRVKRVLDGDRAEEVLTKAGIRDRCVDVAITIDRQKMPEVVAALKAAGIYDEVVTTEEFLSEDKIMQAYAAEELSAEDVDAMFTDSTSWAFKAGYVGRGH